MTPSEAAELQKQIVTLFVKLIGEGVLLNQSPNQIAREVTDLVFSFCNNRK